MKELNKKKVALVIISALVLVAVIIIGIILATNGKNLGGKVATSSKFQNMKIENITVQYNEEKDTTYVNFEVKNTSGTDIQKEPVNLIFKDEKDTDIAGVQITIEYIEAHGEYKTSLSFLGDLTHIKKISLDKTVQAGT